MASFHTIGGFVDGFEPDDLEPTVACHATLRIFSERGLDFDRIEAELGVTATSRLSRGEKAGPFGPASAGDKWLYQAPVDKTADIGEHLRILSDTLLPRADFLLELKKHATLTLSVGYTTNIDHGNFAIPHRQLALFERLALDVNVYLIACPD